MKGPLKVHSLEAIGTLNQDIDVGVIRVSGVFLKRHAKRNSLVRVSLIDKAGRKKKSIVRIVRAATGIKALLKNEIALQYDDRIELGIKQAGTVHTLEIEPVNDWLGIPKFLLGHPSPLVRRENIFAFASMVVGTLIGAIAGFIVGIAM